MSLVAFGGLASVARADEAAAPTLPNVVRIEGFLPAADSAAAVPVNRALGFVVEADGFVLTNYQNLLDPATGRLLEDLRLTLATDSARVVHPARVIGVEPTINLGILRFEPSGPVPVSKVARYFTPPVGAPLAAFVGAPADDVTPGLRRVAGAVIGLNTRECYQENLTSTFYRTDLGLGPDSVGGPVFMAETGAVVGLHTDYKPVPEPGHVEVPGETFVLPVDLCFNIYDSLKQKRSLLSPWTGFSVRGLTPTEASLFPTPRRHRAGVGLEYIWPGGPAEKLGLRVDDILVQFGYTRVESVADFQKWLYMNGVGQKVKLLILRGRDQYLTVDYTIEERPAWARPR